MNLASLHPQYGETWIVFDRDQVQSFDEIIWQAREKGIHVGWTNPCIEEWFCAYFGKMPTYADSVSCCSGFGKIFESVTNQKYEKSDTAIYEKLIRFGKEDDAIKLAQRKFCEHRENGKTKPSEMSPCTTVHLLVGEIKCKIKKE